MVKQGLYDPAFEHDACGIGFIAHIKGLKSHSIIEDSLMVLKNLNHRGASGAEENSGDGAGILTQIPHELFSHKLKQMGYILPDEGQYAVGMVFLPLDDIQMANAQSLVEWMVAEQGLSVITWRDVPVDTSNLGQSAITSMPKIKQVFVRRTSQFLDEMDYERALYIIRKRIEKKSQNQNIKLYFSSFSSRTIVYKGLLTSTQLKKFYLDLTDEDYKSAIAMVHSRFSTNTFPTWERAHPNRYMIHNGEINTLLGNVNWMNTRQHILKSDLFGDDIKRVLPVIDSSGSDSSMFDNCLEFFHLAGRSLPHVMMMMIPESWSHDESMDEDKKAFYEYHGCMMEPWDGPAAMCFTDGSLIGAVLDRNGLRPSRYYITDDDRVILSSEVGVLDIAPERIISKDRVKPGKMLLVDTKEGRIIKDEEIKSFYSNQFPYKEWLNKNLLDFEKLPQILKIEQPQHYMLIGRLNAFGYTYEDLKMIIAPMAKNGMESLGSMGVDYPLAVLSEKPQMLYNYFKQLFAQVTNPPIDAIREEIVTSSDTYIGSDGNILKTQSENCNLIKIKYPVIDNEGLAKLKGMDRPGFKSVVLPMLFRADRKESGLEKAIEDLFDLADREIEKGSNILILSDRGVNQEYAAIPALLAVAGLHHHLIRKGIRTQVALVLESGEPREVHHFSLLIGYGASAINPYLVFETIKDMISQGFLMEISYEKAVKNYLKALTKGIIKVISKMGISTIQSYKGAQIFEAVGICEEVIDKYFKQTPSRIGGVDLKTIEEETLLRHRMAFDSRGNEVITLASGGYHQYRADGEYHMFNPKTIHYLQTACRNGDYSVFKQYSELINDEPIHKATLRRLLKFRNVSSSISIDEVESVESIVKRFKTGAMSFGSISKEAHETIAIAMNRLGGKSNSGEGGESQDRYQLLQNGDSKSSAIKQVASGRFGVTSHYLANAKEIQIKMAQGAKPGEGGQLPAKKVYPWVANTRNSTPGVGLISPPPHHDIYSIEDLAQLIHDLKNANPDARVNVKLVSEAGVGTIAAGVAKGKADVVLISGYDGGTGASPRTSILHAGLPWELGLAETHQTLLLNNLRSRITVEVDGKLLTGRDVVIAAMLGAEEFGFATTPLISLGCVMMRVCNLDTCPVGIATQNPELRKNFQGKPEYVINFMTFIAMEMREIMASLGIRTINELVGRVDLLEQDKQAGNWKSKNVDLSKLLYRPSISDNCGTYCTKEQEHDWRKSTDLNILMNICEPALEDGLKVTAELPVKNTQRVIGTLIGGKISKKFGANGMEEDLIDIKFEGSAGQSFGAFIPKGIKLSLMGDANDGLGKGLSGGKIAVRPEKRANYKSHENVIIGNAALYGATAGKVFISGIAGERFAVRNSGVTAVVEGVGDHGCEYMTGGTVVVMGETGRNFAAGMSGGIAYVYDINGNFNKKCNMEIVNLFNPLEHDESTTVKNLIMEHYQETSSELAKNIAHNWDLYKDKFVKVYPKDYAFMQKAIKDAKDSGLSEEDAVFKAFNLATKE